MRIYRSALLAGCLLLLATCDHKSPARPRGDGSLERQTEEEAFARQAERSPDGVRRYLEKLGIAGHYAGEDTARIDETTAGIEDYHADRAPASRAAAAAPVADAGADQVAAVGSWVILDGRGSRSADGSPLNYRWSAPEGVTLNYTAVRPSFFAAAAGTYRFTLVVNDGGLDSAPVELSVVVVAGPIADAGADQSVAVGTVVVLDGCGSQSADGSPLSYRWSAPAGVTLDDPAAVQPRFTATAPGRYLFRLIVNDGRMDSAPAEVVVTVLAPIADAGADQSVGVGTVVVLDGRGSRSVDGSPLSYRWSAPAGVRLDDPTAMQPSFVAIAVGTYPFRLVVNDGRVDSAPDLVTVNVVTAPLADAGKDPAVPVETMVVLDGGGSRSVDGSPLSYRWSAPAGVRLDDPTAMQPSFVAIAVGAYRFTLIVDDGRMTSAPAAVTVMVSLAPVADAGMDQVVAVGAQVELDGRGSRAAEGAALTYWWSAPAGVTLDDPAAMRPSFTATAVGAYRFTLVVRDGRMASAPAAVMVRVAPPPVADAGVDQVAPVGAWVLLDGSGSRSGDGSPLSYRWSAPAGITLNSERMRPSFLARAPGTYRFSLVVDDGRMASAPAAVMVRVAPPPVADAGVDQVAPVGAWVLLDGSGSRSGDGSPLTYRWSAPAGITLNPERMRPSFLARAPGAYRFSLAVRDGLGESAPSEVVVTVVPIPTADAGADQWVSLGAEVVLDGRGSRSADGAPLSYRWSAPAGVTLDDPVAAQPTFTAASEGAYRFTLLVNDGRRNSAPAEVVVTVLPSLAPVADAGPDRLAPMWGWVVLDGRGSRSADGSPLSYRWSAPAGVTLRYATTAQPTFYVAFTGAYRFTLVVNDGRLASAPAEVTVTVPPPPVADAGPDQWAPTGVRVVLDGRGSHSADGSPLTYRWSSPAGITLDDPTARQPGFTASAVGVYRFTLVVNDGLGDSAPVEVVVTVSMPAPEETWTFALPGGAMLEMRWIEPGTFSMGSSAADPMAYGDEKPQRQVAIRKGFWLGKSVVTQEQWEAVMGTRPWAGREFAQEQGNHSAVYISWDDAQALVQQVNQAAGGSLYRLPTEAEWEYACRAGTATRWSFGDDESSLPEYAWYGANAWSLRRQSAPPVGGKRPNPWGLYDMHGNVWEWCQDWYGTYPSISQTDPTGPATGSGRVTRGGEFVGNARATRAANRGYSAPDARRYNLGVRLAREWWPGE